MRAHCVQQRAQRLRTSPGTLPSTGGIIDRALDRALVPGNVTYRVHNNDNNNNNNNNLLFKFDTPVGCLLRGNGPV